MNFLPCESIDIHIYGYTYNYNFWVKKKRTCLGYRGCMVALNTENID